MKIYLSSLYDLFLVAALEIGEPEVGDPGSGDVLVGVQDGMQPPTPDLPRPDPDHTRQDITGHSDM